MSDGYNSLELREREAERQYVGRSVMGKLKALSTKGVVALLAVVVCAVMTSTAFAVMLLPQASDYTIYYDAGPYDYDSRSDDEYSKALVDSNTGLGTISGTMEADGGSYGVEETLKPNAFKAVGYDFTRWALYSPAYEEEDDEGNSEVIPESVADRNEILKNGGKVLYVPNGQAEEDDEGNAYMKVVATWTLFNQYRVKFFTRTSRDGVDSNGGQVVNLSSGDTYYDEYFNNRSGRTWSGTGSSVAPVTDTTLKMILKADPESDLTDVSLDKIEWYTAPGGPDGDGYKWSDCTSETEFWKIATGGDPNNAVTAEEELRGGNNTQFELILYPWVNEPYSAGTFKIVYSLNDADSGVTGAVPDESTHTVGEPATVAGNTGNLAREGYTFKGWKVGTNGTDCYGPGTDNTTITSSTPGAVINLYPYWDEDEDYTIEFGVGPYLLSSLNSTTKIYDTQIDASATSGLGTTDGTMSAQTATTNNNASVTDNAFSVVGYKFATWAEYWAEGDTHATNGAGAYEAQYVDSNGVAKVKTGDLSDGQSLQLRGVWEPYTDYSVVFYTRTNREGTGEGDEYAVAGTWGSLGWESPIAAFTSTNFTALLAEDSGSDLKDVDLADLEWWTEPGGKGYQWSYGDDNTQLWQLATGNDKSKAVAADKALQNDNNGVVTLYPWVKSVDVMYYGNRGSDDNNAPIATLTQTVAASTVSVDVQEQPGSLTRTGYQFVGWSESSSTEPTAETGIYVPGENSKTLTLNGESKSLYAVWAPNSYTVSVRGDYSDPTKVTATESVTYDVEFELTQPTRGGYTFGGWATKSGVTAKDDPSIISPSSGSVEGKTDKYKNLTVDADGTVPVYPVWLENDGVAVTLSVIDPATGSEASSSTESNPAGSAEATLSAPSDVTGYVFKGWYDSEGKLYGKAEGSESAAYDGTLDGSTVTDCITTWPTEAATLHTEWVERSGYSIKFANTTTHKTESGKPADSVTVNKVSSADIAWTTTGFVPEGVSVDDKSTDGYVFKGWFAAGDLNADGTVKDGKTPISVDAKYSDVATKLELADTNKSGAVLVAGWEADDTEVVLNNGAFTAKNNEQRTPKTSDDETTAKINSKVDANPDLPCPFTIDGYTFKYWQQGSGNDAKYYDAAGAEVDSSGTALTPASKFKAGLKESAGNELTAVWQPITYTVKYDDGSGNKSATTLDVTYDDYAGKKLAAADLFTKDGYQFKEWKNSATSGDEAGKAYAAESDIATNLSAAAGDVVLVAQWSAQVTFTFSKGDGELIAGGELPANRMLLAGSEWNKTDVPYVPVAVQRVGYTANGWTDGAGNDYKHADAGTYTVPDITTPKTVSLYPKWVPNAASVVLHFKDGKTDDRTVSTDTSGAQLVTGASMDLPDSADIEKPGYKFMGWSVADDNAVDQADGDVDASAATYVAPAVKTSPSHLYAVWKAEPITVKFDASSGTGNMADQTDLVAGDETGKLAANAYVRDGYTFAGWVLKSNKADKIDANGCLVSGKAVDYANAQQFTEVNPGPVPEAGDNLVVQLYAAWQAKDFTITFKPNGDDVTPAVEGTQTVSAADSPVKLAGPTYSREGYVFDGWSTSTSRTAYVAGSDWKNNDEDTKYTLDLSGAAGSNTLYAIWKPADGVTYTIERYKQNLAGNGWEKVTAAEHDELIGERAGTTGEIVSIATDPADLYEGFTLDSSVTDQTIESATVSTKLSGEVAADGTLVLRAFYTRNAHTVTYQLAGATSPSGWQLPDNEASVKYGASKTVRTENAVDGWEFSGWTGSYVDAKGNTQTISAGSYDMPDANVVFTGEWTQKSYTVTFGVNDATYEGATDAGAVANTPQTDMKVLSGQKMSADQKTAAQAVTVSVPTRSDTDGKNYYHAGWQKKVGSGAWADCGDPWDEVITGDTVFAPVFKPSFAVVYKPGIGGDWTAADETFDDLAAEAEYTSFSFPKKPADADAGVPKAKAGYTFAGWKLGEATYATTAAFETYVTDDHDGKIWGNLTLEAQWTRDAQSFKIDLDGGKVTAATTIVAADAAAPAQAVTANVGDEGLIEASVGTGLEVTMPAVSKPGCTFGGWSVEPSGSLTSPVGTGGVFYMPALADNETLTLKPNWIAGSATITYRSANADMGSVSPTQQVVNTSTGTVSSATPAGATATLGSTATAAYGYAFDAWKRVDDASNLLADVSGSAITPKAGDDGFTDRTYEASFKADSFEVTIADATLPDGCSVSKGDLPDPVKVDYLGTLTAGEVVATAEANSGYTFAGWLYSMDDDGEASTDPVANDENSLLSDPAELTIKGAVTFTPVFKPNKADVVYNLNDPAVPNAADNTTYAEKADVGSDYTVKGISVLTALDGYVFKGWATASDGAVVYSADDIAAGTADKLKVPAAGTTLYAIWQGATVDITYLPGRHAAEGAVNYVDNTHAAGESNVPVKTNAEASILPADGYMFAGWEGSDGVLYLDPDDPKAAIARLNGPMTMTAQWKLSMSNIVYYANGGYSPDGRGTEIKVDAAAKLQVVAWSVDTVTKGNEGKPIFARDGYTFATWNTRSSGDGDERVPGQIFTMPDSGGVNLYAQWTADAAKLTFDAGDGTFAGNSAQIERSGVTDDKVTMGELPTRSGYDLKGFSRTPGSLVADDDLKDVDENTEFTLGKQGEDGAYEANSTLNAVWVKDGCFVATVSADGVTGGALEGAGDYEVEDGAGLPVDVVATPDDGYELDGWEVNGTLVAEPDPTKLQITEDCTIKPHFKAQSTTPVETYKVTVPAGVQNGSVKGAGVYDVEAGKGIPEGAVVATPATGYKLDGWLVNGTLYNEIDPSKIAIGADTELVPQFSPEEVEEAVDKTALNQAIIVAKAAEEGVETSADGSDVDPADQWTTPAAKKVLDNAIEAAQKVADDPDATQAQVDAATAAVNAARTAYNAAKANGTKGTGKDGGSGNGQGTDPGKDSDGGNGSGGDNGSGNAKANDKSALESAIAAAKAAEQDVETSADGTDVSPSSTWTTPAEKKALDEAIATAEAVLADPDATQDDVNAAKMSLDTARAAYNAGKRPGTKPADGDGGNGNGSGNGNDNGNGDGGNGSGNDSPAGELGKVQAMHRLYNPYSGEHFYTANVAERDDVVAAGWIYEGVGWVAPVESGTPVYRAYSGTDHHYTANWSEIEDIVAAGWTYEGIGWYSDDAESVPLFRQYNPYVEPWADFNNSGSHNYTVDKAENDFLVEVGWIAEGIGWYAIAPDEASIPDGYELVEPQRGGANGSSDLVAAGF